MLIIAGHFTVDPDRCDEYLTAFADLARRACHAPGCLDVAVTADTYERWESWHDVTAWREVANAPEIDIEITDADIAMWDADGERSPFEEKPGAG